MKISSFKFLILLGLAAMPAQATAFLFTSAGAGLTGITVGNGPGNAVLTLSISGNVNMPSSSQVAIELAAGDKLAMTGGTEVGQVDFADTPLISANGGTCPGGCKVNSASTANGITGGSITGGTFGSISSTAAVGQWSGLSSGWAGVGGTDVSLASGGSICTGSFTGCTIANVTAATTTNVNGTLQTAYVFNINNSTIGGPITIKGDGNALIILNYSLGAKLTASSGSKIVVTGGVNSDQVLLTVTSAGGMDMSNSGFVYTGALAINSGSASAVMNLNSAVISGRLFFNDSVTPTNAASLGNGFTLSPTPEPSTMFLIGGALIGIAILSKRFRQQ
ncbi:MAG TPA: PEP-CTERM sorting domain-containing protein [Candidatus Solibacter sp.]